MQDYNDLPIFKSSLSAWIPEPNYNAYYAEPATRFNAPSSFNRGEPNAFDDNYTIIDGRLVKKQPASSIIQKYPYDPNRYYQRGTWTTPPYSATPLGDEQSVITGVSNELLNLYNRSIIKAIAPTAILNPPINPELYAKYVNADSLRITPENIPAYLQLWRYILMKSNRDIVFISMLVPTLISIPIISRELNEQFSKSSRVIYLADEVNTAQTFKPAKFMIRDIIGKPRFIDWGTADIDNLRPSIRTALIDASVAEDDLLAELILLLGRKLNDTFIVSPEVLPADPLDLIISMGLPRFLRLYQKTGKDEALARQYFQIVGRLYGQASYTPARPVSLVSPEGMPDDDYGLKPTDTGLERDTPPKEPERVVENYGIKAPISANSFLNFIPEGRDRYDVSQVGLRKPPGTGFKIRKITDPYFKVIDDFFSEVIEELEEGTRSSVGNAFELDNDNAYEFIEYILTRAEAEGEDTGVDDSAGNPLPTDIGLNYTISAIISKDIDMSEVFKTPETLDMIFKLLPYPEKSAPKITSKTIYHRAYDLVGTIIISITRNSTDKGVKLFNDYWMYISEMDTVLLIQNIRLNDPDVSRLKSNLLTGYGLNVLDKWRKFSPKNMNTIIKYFDDFTDKASTIDVINDTLDEEGKNQFVELLKPKKIEPDTELSGKKPAIVPREDTRPPKKPAKEDTRPQEFYARNVRRASEPTKWQGELLFKYNERGLAVEALYPNNMEYAGERTLTDTRAYPLRKEAKHNFKTWYFIKFIRSPDNVFEYQGVVYIQDDSGKFFSYDKRGAEAITTQLLDKVYFLPIRKVKPKKVENYTIKINEADITEDPRYKFNVLIDTTKGAGFKTSHHGGANPDANPDPNPDPDPDVIKDPDADSDVIKDPDADSDIYFKDTDDTLTPPDVSDFDPTYEVSTQPPDRGLLYKYAPFKISKLYDNFQTLNGFNCYVYHIQRV